MFRDNHHKGLFVVLRQPCYNPRMSEVQSRAPAGGLNTEMNRGVTPYRSISLNKRRLKKTTETANL